MKVLVTSTNPVKVEATTEAFKKAFDADIEIVAESVESNVSDQPMSNEEALTGAKNRVNNAMLKFPKYDYWVGIEAGVEEFGELLSSFTWIAIKSMTKEGLAKSQTYFLPHEVSKLVKEGKELGHAIDEVFNKSNSKQSNGAIGLLTNNLMDRKSIYVESIILALIPFIQNELY
jgi:inosine/xanthosine triphosphatase